MKRLIALLALLPLLAMGGGQTVMTGNHRHVFAAGGTPTWTQKNLKVGSTSATFTNPLTSGSVIICSAGYAQTSAYTLSDTAGNSYADSGFGRMGYSANMYYNQVLIAYNTHTTASDTITASPSDSYQLACSEWTAGGGTISIDQKASVTNQTSGTGGANSLVLPSITTTAAGDLIYVAIGSQSANITAGTSPNAFTLIQANLGLGSEYFIQPAAGAIAATASDTTTGEHWTGIVIAFK
jgi:hypothetical protein